MAEPSLPVRDTARCTHDLLATASCDACVAACPFQAWTLANAGPELDASRCDGCGRCVGACPERALTLEGMSLRRAEPMVVACEKVSAAPASAQTIACLHALGVADLAQLHQAGVRMLYALKGDCLGCPRGAGDSLEDRLAIFNAMLAARVAPALSYTDDAQAVPQPRQPIGQPASGRRAFFRTLVRDPVRAFADTPIHAQALPSPPATSAGTLLARLGNGPLPFAITLDEDNCTLCGACAHVCPHGALRFADQGETGTFHLAAPGCTGCRLCVDVCEADAIRLTAWATQGRSAIALRRARCRACGAPFWLPADREPSPDECPICARTGHHRRLHQVIADD